MEEQDTGEIPVVAPGDNPEDTQRQILAELRSIRYRLGVLVFWFVALPIIAALVAWFVISIAEG